MGFYQHLYEVNTDVTLHRTVMDLDVGQVSWMVILLTLLSREMKLESGAL